MHSLAVYDRELAVERAGGSPELANDLLGMLLKELPMYRDGLAGALAANDLTTLQHHAHKLNGSATYTGVSALRAAVSILEESLRSGETGDLQRQVEDVVTEIRRVLQFAESGI